jgi:outer membrane lipoprotein-sorting protein
MKGSLLRWLPLGAAALASLTLSTITAPASADAAGDKVIASMDTALNRAKTHVFKYEVVNQEPGKAERKLELAVKLKGDKRLTEFLAPADMKGTKVLILSPSQMYVYLPAFGKVRRIASSVSDQGFMGLTFSQDDLSTTKYSAAYTATVASETPTEWKLVMTPKAGQTPPYAKIEVAVTKDRSLPTELRYFNSSGTHIKTESRTGYTCEGNICTPGELKMVDHTKGGHWTKLVRKEWKVNGEIADDVFSKRSLGE